jgi:lipopolysaccharide export system protein LptA
MDHTRPLPSKPRRILMKGLVLGLMLLAMALPTAWGGGDGIKVAADQQVFEPFKGHTEFIGNVKIAMDGTEVTGGRADIQMDDSGKPNTAVFSNRSTLVRKNNGMKQTVQADNLKMQMQSGSLNAQGKVRTEMSGDKNLGAVTIQSETQIFDQEHNVMKAMGNVMVKKDDMTATSPQAMIILGQSGTAEKVIFLNGAKLIQGEQEMSAETITIKLSTGDIYAEKNTKSKISGKDSQGKPAIINIQSHLQELDKTSGTLIANGNTIIRYAEYVATGPKATVYRANNQLDKIVMPGRAQIEDPDRKVTGDTVTIKVNPRQFNAQGNVTTFIKAKKQQTASSVPASTGAGTKAASKSTSTGTAFTPASSAGKELDEELMLEQVKQEAGKTP